MTDSIDFILIESELKELTDFVSTFEQNFDIKIVTKPSLSLTMIRAEDTVEEQEFYLGEALTTDCEVAINNRPGYGICLGDEPQRAYCIAVFDALLQQDTVDYRVSDFLSIQKEKTDLNRKVENGHIQRTRVDFKMMEQA